MGAMGAMSDIALIRAGICPARVATGVSLALLGRLCEGKDEIVAPSPGVAGRHRGGAIEDPLPARVPLDDGTAARVTFHEAAEVARLIVDGGDVLSPTPPAGEVAARVGEEPA